MDISVTMGCIALGQRAMGIASRDGLRSKGDLMSDFVPRLFRRRFKVAAFYTKGLWQDIGTITSYEKVNSELKDDTLSFLRK